MLPDFPLLKEHFNSAVTRVMADRARQYEGVVGTINRARMFEGRRNIIVRPDGEEDETKMAEGASELRISLDELKNLSLQQLLDRLDGIAKDMARQKSGHFFATLREGSKKAGGTTIDTQGKSLTPELFLKALEIIWIDFSPDGSAHMPTMVVPPTAGESVKSLIKQMEGAPELKKQFDRIMRKKREEWNAREADRVLVG